MSRGECCGLWTRRGQTYRCAKHRMSPGKGRDTQLNGQWAAGLAGWSPEREGTDGEQAVSTHSGDRRMSRGCQCHVGSWTLFSSGFRPTHPPSHWMSPPECPRHFTPSMFTNQAQGPHPTDSPCQPQGRLWFTLLPPPCKPLKASILSGLRVLRSLSWVFLAFHPCPPVLSPLMTGSLG